MRGVWLLLVALQLFACVANPLAQDTKSTEVFARIYHQLSQVASISTHEHLKPFRQLTPIERFQIHGNPSQSEGALRRIWQATTFSWTHPLTPWSEDGLFETWWSRARTDFLNARATSVYRVMLPAFQDLYGVDFDTISDQQALKLNRQISLNYQDEEWLRAVITEKANIELMIIDPSWAPLSFKTEYPFAAPTCNVGSLTRGFHRSEFRSLPENPYDLAKELQGEIRSLDDYLNFLDLLLGKAKSAGAVALKSTLAYRRSLSFRNVPREKVEVVFGRPRDLLTTQEIRAFEDFIMWRLVELSAKHDLPFQIHTGYARIQGSSPMLLVDLIRANPKTTFVLFHGGFPWISEVGLIAMTSRNVHLDSCWLPTASYTMAKRAFSEWLDMVPSNRIMWGSDMATAEGIYGATKFVRLCLAEVLTEKVIAGELLEEHAHKIGRQIMRENALELFPPLRKLLWRAEVDGND